MTDKIDIMFLNYKNYLKYRSASFSARFKYLYKFKSQIIELRCSAVPVLLAVMFYIMTIATIGNFSDEKLNNFFIMLSIGSIFTWYGYSMIFSFLLWILSKMFLCIYTFKKCLSKEKVSLVKHYINNAQSIYFKYNYHYDGILSTTFVCKFIKQLTYNEIKLTKKEKEMLLPYLDDLKKESQAFLDDPLNDEIGKTFREEHLEERRWDMNGGRD